MVAWSRRLPGPSMKAWMSQTSCSFGMRRMPSRGSDVISDISLSTRLITWGGIFSVFLTTTTKNKQKSNVNQIDHISGQINRDSGQTYAGHSWTVGSVTSRGRFERWWDETRWMELVKGTAQIARILSEKKINIEWDDPPFWPINWTLAATAAAWVSIASSKRNETTTDWLKLAGWLGWLARTRMARMIMIDDYTEAANYYA